jgi:hypothetical protein
MIDLFYSYTLVAENPFGQVQSDADLIVEAIEQKQAQVVPQMQPALPQRAQHA